MAELKNLKLTLTSDRKLQVIECDDFRIKLNGNSNADYTTMLKPLGIVLTFVAEAPDVVAKDEVIGVAHNESVT